VGNGDDGLVVGLRTIRRVRHRLSGRRVEVHADGCNLFALTGPWAPYLAVLLVHALSGRFLDLPAAPPATAQVSPPPPPRNHRRRLDWLIG
jgi:hypothetical protein